MAAEPQDARLDTFVQVGPIAPTYVVPVTDANIVSEVGRYRGPLVLVLSAPACDPCTTMIPIMDALAERYGGQVKFCRIDNSWKSGFVRDAGITATPSFIYLKDYKAIAISQGAVSAESMMANIAAYLGVPRPD